MANLRKRQIKILSLVLSLVALMAVVYGLGFHIKSTQAVMRDLTYSATAHEDAYVDNSTTHRSINYGNDVLMVGNCTTLSGWDFTEAYLNFTCANRPTGWTKAEIWLTVYAVNGPDIGLDVTMCLVTQEWDESTITWNNKPPHGSWICDLYIDSAILYKIDISSMPSLNTMDSISVCLNASDATQRDRIGVTNSENGVPSAIPQLVWTKTENAQINVTSPKSGDTYNSGSYTTFPITWTSQGTFTYLRLELYQGDVKVFTIGSGNLNNGQSYMMLTSEQGYVGSDFRIKITDINDANVYGFSDYFTITAGQGISGYDTTLLFTVLFGTVFAIAFCMRKRHFA